MFATRSEIVHETRFPLIALERHRVALEPAVVGRARRELLAASDPGSEFRLGFLLGLQAEGGTHPACLHLSRALREQTLGRLEEEADLSFSLSFLKLAVGMAPAAEEGPMYEGPHLDSHPGLEGSVELLRLLVNLSAHPRRFLYAATDRWRLAEEGVPHGRREFEALSLPATVETRTIAIPGRTATTVHALKFFASAVPHVGLNDPPEHFLASFEALADLAAFRPRLGARVERAEPRPGSGC
jgi:hypothetical protein